MLRMDQVHVIRHKVLIEGQSIRRVARELGLSRNTVSKYLEQSAAGAECDRGRSRPVWERVQPRLEELLAEWEPRTTAKQRLTGSGFSASWRWRAIRWAPPWYGSICGKCGASARRSTCR